MEKSNINILASISFCVPLNKKSFWFSKDIRVSKLLVWYCACSIEKYETGLNMLHLEVIIFSFFVNSHTCTLWLWIDLTLFDLRKANRCPKKIKIKNNLLKQRCRCPRILEVLMVFCFAQTLMPITKEGGKEEGPIELMSAMRQLNKLYQP